MTPPSGKTKQAVTTYVQAAAELAGVPPSDLDTQDLQVMALAVRESDTDPNGVAIANALDSLSELKDDDVAWLNSIPDEPPQELAS